MFTSSRLLPGWAQTPAVSPGVSGQLSPDWNVGVLSLYLLSNWSTPTWWIWWKCSDGSGSCTWCLSTATTPSWMNWTATRPGGCVCLLTAQIVVNRSSWVHCGLFILTDFFSYAALWNSVHPPFNISLFTVLNSSVCYVLKQHRVPHICGKRASIFCFPNANDKIVGLISIQRPSVETPSQLPVVWFLSLPALHVYKLSFSCYKIILFTK